MVTDSSNKFLKDQITKLKADKDYISKRIGDINVKIDALRVEKDLLQVQINDITTKVNDLQADLNP